MITNFNSNEIALMTQQAIIENNVELPPFYFTKYVWIDEDNAEDIIDNIKKSQFAYTIDKEIFFFPENSKYFATDKNFVFSISTFELNKENKDKSQYNFAELMECKWCELWPELRKTSEYFAHTTIQHLTGRTIRAVLDKATAAHLEARGYKIVKQPYKNNKGLMNMLSINKDIFVEWCKTGERPTITKKKAGRKGLAIKIIIDGIEHEFSNLKECHEKMFSDIKYETFKKKCQRAKDGNFKINGINCLIVP